MALPQELSDPLGASQSKVTIKTVSAELWLGNDTGFVPLNGSDRRARRVS